MSNSGIAFKAVILTCFNKFDKIISKSDDAENKKLKKMFILLIEVNKR